MLKAGHESGRGEAFKDAGSLALVGNHKGAAADDRAGLRGRHVLRLDREPASKFLVGQQRRVRRLFGRGLSGGRVSTLSPSWYKRKANRNESCHKGHEAGRRDFHCEPPIEVESGFSNLRHLSAAPPSGRSVVLPPRHFISMLRRYGRGTANTSFR
jgi:hypothetical protein